MGGKGELLKNPKYQKRNLPVQISFPGLHCLVVPCIVVSVIVLVVVVVVVVVVVIVVLHLPGPGPGLGARCRRRPVVLSCTCSHPASSCSRRWSWVLRWWLASSRRCLPCPLAVVVPVPSPPSCAMLPPCPVI